MRVRVSHTSLEYDDSNKQHAEDLRKIFSRGSDRRVGWITGTESGPGSGNTAHVILDVADKFGYTPWVPSLHADGAAGATDCWIAVRSDLISGKLEKDFRPAIPGSNEVYRDLGVDPPKFPHWGPKGLVTVAFDCKPLQGRVNIGAAHYLQDGRRPGPDDYGVDRWELNSQLAVVIGDWAKEVARGNDLAFYAGDQNMADDKNDEPQGDTFFGEPLTSLGDELKNWQNTGHGPGDVIASFNKDHRVSGLEYEVYDDKEFHLNGDHYYLEGIFNVKPLTS